MAACSQGEAHHEAILAAAVRRVIALAAAYGLEAARA
jgi:hypothetical protein